MVSTRSQMGGGVLGVVELGAAASIGLQQEEKL